MEQLNSGVPVYNESEAVRLLGELNIDLLEKALNVIIARHEILRTTIQVAGDEVSAVVHESWPLRLKQIDLSLLPRSQREAEVERLLIDEPRLPYHLETEPGIRATLLRLGQNGACFDPDDASHHLRLVVDRRFVARTVGFVSRRLQRPAS